MQSIGERLEEARKRKGISIREAAEATKIRSDYLHKFESNQFDIKLPEIYVRGFLRTYANYLKVPPDKIVSDYNGLGLAESRSPRSLNREVYGRMDLSVSSAKAEKESKETTPPAEAVEKPQPTETRNPALFVPKPAGGLPLDRDLLVKGIGIIAGAIVVLVILLYLIFGRGEKTPSVPPSPDVTWVHPQTGERTLTLVAVDRVQVTVVQTNTGQTIYQGAIPRGDRREIPYRGELRINSDIPSNLRVNINGTDWELRDPKSNAFLSSAIIQAPR